jgi:hypothetical protein
MLNQRIDMGWRTLVVILAALASTACPGRHPQMSDEARVAGATWLLENCGVGGQHQPESVLVQHKAELEPFFLDAFRLGPDRRQIAQVLTAADQKFEDRAQMLKTGTGLGLSGPDLDHARSVTRGEYVAGERENFVLRYKSRALAGLGVVSGPQGRAVLEGVARDQASPLRTTAQDALQHLDGKTPIRGE